MASEIPASLASGAVLGAALSYAGLSSPSTVIDQMRLTSFHMMKVFLTATASSTIIIALLSRFNLADAKPRQPVSLGYLGLYDGNLLGGLLFGVGLTLGGSCPATVFTQLAHGYSSAGIALAGGITGSALYQIAVPTFQLLRPVTQAPTLRPTLPSTLGISTTTTIPTFVALLSAAVALFSTLDDSPLLWAINGGLYIGAAQFAKVFLTGSPLGVSAAFKQPVLYVLQLWDSLTPHRADQKKPSAATAAAAATNGISHRATALAAGIYIGALASKPLLASNDAYASMLAQTAQPDISGAAAFVGGALTIFGARLADGCTSGHGISGMSTLSVASFVTVASMFAGGIATAMLMPSS